MARVAVVVVVVVEVVVAVAEAVALAVAVAGIPNSTAWPAPTCPHTSESSRSDLRLQEYRELH